MVAVRTRSRRARQKVSDGNPRSGADRGGRANKARAPASSSPGDSRSSECSRVDTGRRRRLAASSAGDFDLAGVGAPRRMASSVRADHSAADRLLAFSRSCGGGARGNLRFLHTCAHTPNSNLCRGGGGEANCEREMPRSISPRRFRRKVQRRVYCILYYKCHATRGRARRSSHRVRRHERPAPIAVRKRG